MPMDISTTSRFVDLLSNSILIRLPACCLFPTCQSNCLLPLTGLAHPSSRLPASLPVSARNFRPASLNPARLFWPAASGPLHLALLLLQKGFVLSALLLKSLHCQMPSALAASKHSQNQQRYQRIHPKAGIYLIPYEYAQKDRSHYTKPKLRYHGQAAEYTLFVFHAPTPFHILHVPFIIPNLFRFVYS